jgi:hypothetical protein
LQAALYFRAALQIFADDILATAFKRGGKNKRIVK